MKRKKQGVAMIDDADLENELYEKWGNVGSEADADAKLLRFVSTEIKSGDTRNHIDVLKDNYDQVAAELRKKFYAELKDINGLDDIDDKDYEMNEEDFELDDSEDFLYGSGDLFEVYDEKGDLVGIYTEEEYQEMKRQKLD